MKYKTSWPHECHLCVEFRERAQKNILALFEQRNSCERYRLSILHVFASLHFAGRVEWMSPVGVRRSQEVTRCTQQPTHTNTQPHPQGATLHWAPGAAGLQGGWAEPKSTTPQNRMESLGNVVWARLRIVHYSTKSWGHRTWSVWVKFYQLCRGSFH